MDHTETAPISVGALGSKAHSGSHDVLAKEDEKHCPDLELRGRCRADLLPQPGCETVTCLTPVFRTGSRREVQESLPQKTRDPKLLCLPVKEASPAQP